MLYESLQNTHIAGVGTSIAPLCWCVTTLCLLFLLKIESSEASSYKVQHLAILPTKYFQKMSEKAATSAYTGSLNLDFIKDFVLYSWVCGEHLS